MPPPANDNFANATLIATAGTLVGDNTDATSDGPDDPLVNVGAYGIHTVWYRIDSTSTGFLTIGTDSAGGSPIIDSVIGVYQGTTLPGLVELDVDDDGGTGTYSQITNLAITGGDPIYIEVTGYSDSHFGTYTLTWSFAECLDAVDIINPDSSTATVVSGRVREAVITNFDIPNPYNVPEKTLKWNWTGAPGQYQVTATGQPASSVSSGSVYVHIYVNGRAFFRSRGTTAPGTSAVSWIVHNGFDSGADLDTYNTTDYPIFPWIPIDTGDEIEVYVHSFLEDGSFNAIAFDLDALCFSPDAVAPVTSYCTPSISWEEKPIGDEWGSYRGWGGQKLIPDQIWTHLGQTPYDDSPGNYSWGVNFSDYDMCVLPDGTVYVIYMEEVPASASVTDPPPGGGFANSETGYFYMVVKKYNPNTDTWTQIATLNKFDPIDGSGHAVGCLAGPHQCESANAYYDPIGGQVYFAWIEASYYYGSFPDLDQKAYVARLDPSDDSWVYLGDGVQALAHANLGNYDRFSTLGVTIAVTENGDVYIGTVEKNTATVPLAPKRHSFVWRWDGASWTNLNLPAPSVSVSGVWSVDGENQFWDQLVMVVPYRRNGSQDGITVFYSFLTAESDVSDSWKKYQSVTIEYTPGGGWTDEILTLWPDVEGHTGKRVNGGVTFPNEYILRVFDPTLMWSASLGRLVLAADMFSLGSGDEIWDMFQMNDAGDQWEILVPGTAPPSSAGPWRQSRNSADIGPDGEIFRALMTDQVNLDFTPNVVKRSTGYAFGYADASVRHIGELTNYQDANGISWLGAYVSMNATTNLRIRWSGAQWYVITQVFTEPLNVLDIPEDDGDSPFGEGVFVFRGTYVPCTRTYFYGSIKRP